MRNYKNYIIGIGILILGIILGNVFSGDKNENTYKEGKHEYVQDPVTKFWTCSMHPQIKMQKPGNCPVCGMDLIPLDKANNLGNNIASNEIVMTEEAVQLANIQTSKVVISNAKKEVRLLGTVKPDERRQYSQVSHIPGRIEKLYLNFTGEKVRKGQRIVRLYSPELISAQKELFEAMKSKDIYPQLFKASRNKLKLWKLTDAQIDAIVNSGKVQEQIDILSDYSGYVMKRNVELGDHVMEGMKLFEIANIDVVWIMFEAYEADIPWVHIGDAVEFILQAMPGKTYQGKVTYIDPFISANTRVAKVRVEVKNPKHKLLPEMYANGIIKAKLTNTKNALIIPKSAVLWTGKRVVTYVKVPRENIISFVYREVILGANLGDFYIVEKGLEEGEEIATNGVFRIDASAQLLGQKSMMNPEGGKMNSGGHKGMDKGGGNDYNGEMKSKSEENMRGMIIIDKTKIDKEFKKQLGVVIADYISLKDALVNENANQAIVQVAKMQKSINKVDMLLLLEDAHNIWMKALKPINKNMETIKINKNIEVQRKEFGLLSKKLSDAIDVLGVETIKGETLYLEYCQMADNNIGGFWLSYDKEIRNPFFGKKMMNCGEVKKTY